MDMKITRKLILKIMFANLILLSECIIWKLSQTDIVNLGVIK